MTGRAGFTLLEALASVVVLALLAAWTIPVARGLGEAPARAAAEAQARALLAGMDSAQLALLLSGTQPAMGDPAWRAVAEPLVEAPTAVPARHRWMLVRVLSGRDGREVELARRLAALPAPQERTP